CGVAFARSRWSPIRNSGLVQRKRAGEHDHACGRRLWASVGAPLAPCIPCVSTSALARSFVLKGKDARSALQDAFHPALAEERTRPNRLSKHWRTRAILPQAH